MILVFVSRCNVRFYLDSFFDFLFMFQMLD
uniref:Uncharacterized protein n=1 Tax=Anguilla anguilla TaxID=7936 RepID=A0A0E9Q154_ANGAN